LDASLAVTVAAEVEFLAGVYLQLLPLGEPARIDPDEMRAVIDRFRSYGRQGGEVWWPSAESRF
jgi:L-fuculose-phosphate aldolase